MTFQEALNFIHPDTYVRFSTPGSDSSVYRVLSHEVDHKEKKVLVDLLDQDGVEFLGAVPSEGLDVVQRGFRH
jgi:hypothetical protein